MALAAGLQLILACENAPMIEYDAYGGPGWDGLLDTAPLLKNGFLEATDAPGLGVQLSEDAYGRVAL
ncbi:MAG: hypothetical protein QMB06_06885 [Pontimonas sp.]